MRRQDRAVKDEEWIDQFLAQSPTGVLSTVSDGQPFLTPNTFYYDVERHAIYMHTASHGRTRDNVEQDNRVCFCVFRLGRLLPADRAKELSTEFASVVIFGRGIIVENRQEAREALQELADKYFPHLTAGKDYQQITPSEVSETTVFRIDIDQWSAKQKKVDQEFPGAFEYGHQSS